MCLNEMFNQEKLKSHVKKRAMQFKLQSQKIKFCYMLLGIPSFIDKQYSICVIYYYLDPFNCGQMA